MEGPAVIDAEIQSRGVIGAQTRGEGRHRANPPSRSGNLKQRFDPRLNHLSTIRLTLAITVAIVHSLQIGFGHQPSIGSADIGELAVDAFFVLSGYLLAGSYVRLGSIRRYVWHRFLRIMPGFWVCLLVTALLVAPAVAYLQGLSATSVFSGEESAFQFLIANSLLMMRQFGVAGLPVGVPDPGVLNGSLWTLFYEALCYGGVVVLGVIGALKRRPWITLLAIGALWVVTVVNLAGPDIVSQERLLRFALMFLFGSALFLYADRVPVRGDLALAAAAVLLVALLTMPDYRPLAGPALAYLCLWLVVIHPPRWAPKSDFSYGLYVYHWPILQILTVAGVTQLGQAAFVIIGVAMAMAASLFSWDWIEEPALRFKNAAWVTPNRRKSSSPAR